MPMKIGIYCMVRVVCLDQREYMFENFEENHVLLRPGAKVTQFYADGVDYALADGTTGSLRVMTTSCLPWAPAPTPP